MIEETSSDQTTDQTTASPQKKGAETIANRRTQAEDYVATQQARYLKEEVVTDRVTYRDPYVNAEVDRLTPVLAKTRSQVTVSQYLIPSLQNAWEIGMRHGIKLDRNTRTEIASSIFGGIVIGVVLCSIFHYVVGS